MAFNLKGRHLLTMKHYSQAEISFLLELSEQFKKNKYAGIYPEYLKNKNIALIFEKPSTRTRCAFIVASSELGGHAEYLGKNDIQMGKKESVKDTARVLGRMFDGIMFRGFLQKTVEELAEYSGVPVWNGLTDTYHPTQILADLMTIKEKFGILKGLKLCYLGDGRNNVANSLLVGCVKMGMHYSLGCPKTLLPSQDLLEWAKKEAEMSGSSITISHSPQDSVKNADVIYTDVWVSMGEEELPGIKERVESLKPFQVNSSLLKATGKDTIFMHCLPAVHGNEVSDEVFESKASVVFDEAENRIHTIKAIMVATI